MWFPKCMPDSSNQFSSLPAELDREEDVWGSCPASKVPLIGVAGTLP